MWMATASRANSQKCSTTSGALSGQTKVEIRWHIINWNTALPAALDGAQRQQTLQDRTSGLSATDSVER